MAVLVEAISVVVRRDAIEQRHLGGWDRFVREVPNPTFCSDGELVRVGFMAPQDMEWYTERLGRRGLRPPQDGQAMDFVVVDQQRGPAAGCEWIEFARLSFPPGGPDARVSACWLFEGPRIAAGIHLRGAEMQLAVPAGWEYKESLSHSFIFVPEGEVEQRLRFLRHERGTDVYLDLESGKEVYEGRAGADGT